MGVINIYHEENDATYQVYVDLNSRLLANDANNGGTGVVQYYLDIYSNVPNPDGTGQNEHYVVQTLNDVAPNAINDPASDFQELIIDYIKYFMSLGELGLSSSTSSSSNSSSSSSSSSSSTSEGFSSSSSSQSQ